MLRTKHHHGVYWVALIGFVVLLYTLAAILQTFTHFGNLVELATEVSVSAFAGAFIGRMAGPGWGIASLLMFGAGAFLLTKPF